MINSKDMPEKGQITCESCSGEVPEDNIDRVAACQMDENDCFNLDITNVPTCNCCNACRANCANSYYNERTDNKA